MSQQTVTIGVLALQGAFIEHISYLTHCLPSTSSFPSIHAIPVRSPAELAQCAALVIPGGESTVIHSVAERTPGMLPALLEFVRDPSKAVWGTCAGMILMAEEEGVGGGKVIPGREKQRGWGGIEGLRVWRNLYGTQLESFEAPLLIPDLASPSTPFNAIFIRAPAVHSLRPATLVDHTRPSLPSPTPSSTQPTKSAFAHNGVVHAHGLPTPAPTPPLTPRPEATPSAGRAADSPSPRGPVIALATLPAEFHPPPPPADDVMGAANPADLGTVMLRQGKKMVTSFHPELSGDTRVHRFWVEQCVLAAAA